MFKKILKVQIIFFVFASFITCASFAKSAADAEDFIQKTSQKVMSIVEANESDIQTQNSLKKIFNDVMDVSWIGRFVIAQHWNQLSATQREKYMNTYREFLSKKYVSLFKDYNGQKLVIKDTKDIGQDQFVVTTAIKNPNNNGDYKIEYRLKYDSSFKVRDIIAENVSMINTQRSEFSSILSSKGFDGLIDILQAKYLETPKE